MKVIKYILFVGFVIIPTVIFHAVPVGEGRGEMPEEQRLQERYETRKGDIEKLQEKIAQEAERTPDEIAQKAEDNRSLNRLLKEQQTDVQVILDQPNLSQEDQRKWQNENKTVQEHQEALKKEVSRLTTALERSGRQIGSVTPPDVTISFKEALAQEKIVLPPTVIDKLTAWFKDVYARINEVINPQKAQEIRKELDDVYRALNNPLKQAENAHRLGMLIPIEQAQEAMLQYMKALDIYTQEIKRLDHEIRQNSGDKAAKEREKLRLQQDVVQKLVAETFTELNTLRDIAEDREILAAEDREILQKAIDATNKVIYGKDMASRTERAQMKAQQSQAVQKFMKNDLEPFLAAVRTVAGYQSSLDDVFTLKKKLTSVLQSMDFAAIEDAFLFFKHVNFSQLSPEEIREVSRVLATSYGALADKFSQILNKQEVIDSLSEIENQELRRQAQQMEQKAEKWFDALQKSVQEMLTQPTQFSNEMNAAIQAARPKIKEIRLTVQDMRQNVEKFIQDTTVDFTQSDAVIKSIQSLNTLITSADPSLEGKGLFSEGSNILKELMNRIELYIDQARTQGKIITESELTTFAQVYAHAALQQKKIKLGNVIAQDSLIQFIPGTLFARDQFILLPQVSREQAERMKYKTFYINQKADKNVLAIRDLAVQAEKVTKRLPQIPSKTDIANIKKMVLTSI